MKDKTFIFLVILIASWAVLHVFNYFRDVNLMSLLRDKVSKQHKEFNDKVLAKELITSEFYKRADIDLDFGIKYVDSILNNAQIPDSNELRFLKAQLYYENNMIDSALNSLNFAESTDGHFPRNKIYKAACYIKLNKNDEAMVLLKQASYPNYDHKWYIGNLYEIMQDKTAAIEEYNFLYQKDTIIYAYCKERINQINEGQPLMTELFMKDRRKRMFLLFENVDKNDPSRVVSKVKLHTKN